MQSLKLKNLSMFYFNFFLLQLQITLNILSEPFFQILPSSPEVLLMDSCFESEALIFQIARKFTVCFLFFHFKDFSTFFSTITFASCLVYFNFLLKCLLFFCFVCLVSALSIVHSSIVCPHVPWYLQNFLSFPSSSAETSCVRIIVS